MNFTTYLICELFLFFFKAVKPLQYLGMCFLQSIPPFVSQIWRRRRRRRRRRRTFLTHLPSIHPWGPYSVQSVGTAKAVSLVIGHNPGQVATPTQVTSKLALILSTSEGWRAESTPPGINYTAEGDLNSGSEDPKPTTLTMKPTPGINPPCLCLKDNSNGFLLFLCFAYFI